MSDSRLHLRIVEGWNADTRTLCGLKAVNVRAQSIYWSEFEHAQHMSGDVCAECTRIGAPRVGGIRRQHDTVHAMGTFWVKSARFPTVCHYHGHCIAPQDHDHVDVLGDGSGWHDGE